MTPSGKLPKKQASMLTWPVIRMGLSYILSGKLYVKHGHLPITGHEVPADFIGVCVASAQDAAMDDYVIQQLNALGTKQVRLDFTYGDLNSFNARFLERLIAHNFKVTLHIVQPFHSARKMESASEQATWQAFLIEVLNRFGSQVTRIEIGTTINRKRWAGYTVDGFLHAWDIAYTEVKKRQIPLAGPNVTDFEPIYNIAILKILKAKNQLPDIHTNNMFSERVTEPERFDHRIFKYRWATIFKVNLIKKVRLLKKVSADFGVSSLMSPAAFWAIYRIQRILPAGTQKQADYAARYMLLNAASGALDQAFWGSFICHREGLIDDGLKDADYPVLERVAHYANVDGDIKDFKKYPSFHAIKTVASMVQGARYTNTLASSNGLEMHHFQTAQHEIHAMWTINGKVAFLEDIYHANDIQQAEIINRDGQQISGKSILITESPIYLRWPKGYQAITVTEPTLAKDLVIHAHIEGLNYYPFRQDDWFGLILAKDADEAALLAQQLNPAQLMSPQKEGALRHARNAIWAVTDPRNPAQQITIKQPVKMYPHKAFLDRFKPSKAKRSWNGAVELLRRGIDSAHPVAFFEKQGDVSLKQNFYICDFVKADCSIGEMFISFSQGNKEFANKDGHVISAEETYIQLAHYLNNMHKRGVYFRDLSGGNVLVKILVNKTLHFSLIDTARARFFAPPMNMSHRLSDMTRVCNKLHWAGRERLMSLYLANSGRKFSFKYKLAFYLYDFKVELKRKIGRKGIKKLIKKLKQLKPQP
ncbi:MAG TPA: hypothetical protein VK967_00065 [Methylotenera sp.]|nr:hypothetical protein [Methylotenera sp.]